MDGVHDMGGLEGFGPVVREADETVFHHDWERRVFGLNFSSLPGANVDRFRHAIERMGAVEYLTTSYYEHWLAAIETMAVDTGAVAAADLEDARSAMARGATPARRHDPDRAAALVTAVQTPTATTPPVAPTGRHAVGDRVRVRRESPRGHTRCPRYARGAVGVVSAVHAPARLPDASAGSADVVEPLYGVSFAATELWGQGDHRVCLDLWESYLEDPRG